MVSIDLIYDLSYCRTIWSYHTCKSVFAVLESVSVVAGGGAEAYFCFLGCYVAFFAGSASCAKKVASEAPLSAETTVFPG